MKKSLAKVGEGEAAAFSDAPIQNCKTVDMGTTIQMRDGFVEKLYPTRAATLKSDDPRVAHAQKIWGADRKAEQQGGEPMAVPDSSDVKMIRKSKDKGQWGGC